MMDEITSSESEDPLPPIPDKRLFLISEVAELCSVKPHVLRYWESEFVQLRPSKRENRRYYTRSDVQLVRQIRDLLYVQLFTIKGARVVLEGGGNTQLVPTAMEPIESSSRLFPFLGSRRKPAVLDFPELAEGIEASSGKAEQEKATTDVVDRQWLQKELHSTLALLRGQPDAPEASALSDAAKLATK